MSSLIKLDYSIQFARLKIPQKTIYEGHRLLGYSTVWFWFEPTFRRIVSPPSSGQVSNTRSYFIHHTCWNQHIYVITTSSSLDELMISTEPKNDRYRLLRRLSYSVSCRSSGNETVAQITVPSRDNHRIVSCGASVHSTNWAPATRAHKMRPL
jgi:hypothetical protein